MSWPSVAPFAITRRSRDLRRARARLLASDSTSRRQKRLLARLSLAVHRRDTMYERGRGQHYLSVGLSAVACVEKALRPDHDPDSILDFACGYGRVLRFLKVRFPGAHLAAAEIEPPAVGFCRRAFGVQAFASATSLESLRLPDQYDLIWCGSLITHLDRPSAGHLLGFFARHLSTRGLCVFSAHGSVSERRLRSDADAYGLAPDAARTVLQGFDEAGYGYVDYPGHRGYGISLVAKDTLAELAIEADLRESSFQPQAWDDHHDVYGFVPGADSGGSLSP